MGLIAGHYIEIRSSDCKLRNIIVYDFDMNDIPNKSVTKWIQNYQQWAYFISHQIDTKSINPSVQYFHVFRTLYMDV